MHTFLADVSQKIYNNHKNNLNEVAIIIPNRRASVYIQKHLSNLSDAPFFAPKITTINEWIDENTTEQILSQTELLFILFNIYASVDKEEAEDFDSFLKWGKVIISDFDEIDRYIVSPKEIFRDLRNIKDIENWSFDSAELSDGQKKYADLWDKLPIYYQKFNAYLTEIGATYQGRAYQNFSKKTEFNNPSSHKHYYFVGFNALSRSEERIIENLKRQKICTVYFDVDKHYINNPEHEAGYFYRKLRDKWHLKEEIPNNINLNPKHFEVIETAQQVAQSKIAGHIIKDFDTVKLNNTAIVLADESLLIPLSKSLPVTLSKANITMGYPIKYSHLKSLFDLVFDFQHHFKKFNSDKLYHKTLLKFIDHPFIQSLIDKKNAIAEFENSVVRQNKIFVNHSELVEVFPNLKEIDTLLSPWHNDTINGLKAIKNFIQVLYANFKKTNTNDLELEILYHFSKGINRFEKIWLKYPQPLNLKSFKQLFQQFWQNESLSFLGNPTEGLQIMGVLETRTLDFENLIILSLNEGNLPKSNFSISLIPRELKLFHKLPVEQDRDAIFAHHFYRLIHNAKNIYMTYNSTSDGIGNSEKSRFITQIENELDFENFHTLKTYTYNASDKSALISEPEFEVNETVVTKLDELFTKGLSPSALNTFIRCPLDFYYKYILGLREANEVEETIEASTFGTMIHDVLERIFKDNFLTPNKPVSIDVLKAEKKNVEGYLKTEYLKEFTASDIKYGQNKLSFEVSLRLIESFIDKQIEELKKTDSVLYIKSLEEDIEANFDWQINGIKKQIKIKGVADRIEQFGPTHRIIDYKSGKCDKTKISLAKKVFESGDLESFIQDEKKSYAKQLLMYALMFKQSYPKVTDFSAGIISMINLKDWVQNVHITGDKSEFLSDDLLDMFTEELKIVVETMYDKNFIYKHNPKSDYCDYCGK